MKPQDTPLKGIQHIKQIDYSHWFNKSTEQQTQLITDTIIYMERHHLHYIIGDQEALPLISCIVLQSLESHPIYGSFYRTTADRNSTTLEGNPPQSNQPYLHILQLNQL